MSSEQFKSTSNVKLEQLESVVKMTLQQKNLGFFLICEDQSHNIKAVLMASFEFTDWRDGVFYWIQFVEADSEKLFLEIIDHFKSLVSCCILSL